MMNRPARRSPLPGVVQVLCIIFLAGAAHAGIPEPGIILYGKVFDDTGGLVTSGELAWTYAEEAGGNLLVVSTKLQSIEGAGGPYSYRIRIPLETEVAGFPVSEYALAATDVPAAYMRSAVVSGTSIGMTHPITLSRADRGTAVRVDVCVTCSAAVRFRHSADVDGDFRFTLSEFLRALELHTGTDSHEYHVDMDGEDGYSLGPGSHDGLPHSLDFESGGDWQISMTEALRMIDLFIASPDHSYHPDSTGDDGFNKGLADLGPGSQLAKSIDSDPSGLTVNRHLVDGSLDPMDQTLEFMLEIDSADEKSISALGIQEYLPAGWSFVDMTDGADPFIVPKFNDSGLLEFAWLSVPELPHRLSYKVAIETGADLLRGLDRLSGRGKYRTINGTRLHQARLSSTLFQDDGNGIPDLLEALAPVGGTSAGPEAPAGERASGVGTSRTALARARGRLAPEGAASLGNGEESDGRFDLSARTAPGTSRTSRAPRTEVAEAPISTQRVAAKAVPPGVPSQSPLGLLVLSASIGVAAVLVLRRRNA